MARNLLLLLVLVTLAAAMADQGNAGMTPAELYWRSTFPESQPMPASLSAPAANLLYPSASSSAGSSSSANPLFFYGHASSSSANPLEPFWYHHASSSSANALQVFVYYHYASSSSEEPIDDDKAFKSLFFLQASIPALKLFLSPPPPAASGGAVFFPRCVADSIPLSAADLLGAFSIDPASPAAAAIRTTLSLCEAGRREEITRYNETMVCASSLESMVEYAMSSLGTRHIRPLSTPAPASKSQWYTALSAVPRSVGAMVACHPMAYPFKMFGCHSPADAAATRKLYEVEMAGEDGTTVKLPVVCHLDTAGWDPKYPAFRVLGANPGDVLCHYLPYGHLMWIPAVEDA